MCFGVLLVCVCVCLGLCCVLLYCVCCVVMFVWFDLFGASLDYLLFVVLFFVYVEYFDFEYECVVWWDFLCWEFFGVVVFVCGNVEFARFVDARVEVVVVLVCGDLICDCLLLVVWCCVLWVCECLVFE